MIGSMSMQKEDSLHMLSAYDDVDAADSQGSASGTPQKPARDNVEFSESNDAEAGEPEAIVIEGDGGAESQPTPREEQLSEHHKELQAELDRLLPATDVQVATDERISENIRRYIEKGGYVSYLLNSKAIRNPGLLGQIVKHFDLKEYGSNFPEEKWNAYGHDQSEYLLSLQEKQRKMYEHRRKMQTMPRSTIPFVSSTSSLGGGGSMRETSSMPVAGSSGASSSTAVSAAAARAAELARQARGDAFRR